MCASGRSSARVPATTIPQPHPSKHTPIHLTTTAALRVIEVRDAYCRDEFEWDQLRRLAEKDTKAANLRLMRAAASASLNAGVGGGAGAAAAEAAGGSGGEGDAA